MIIVEINNQVKARISQGLIKGAIEKILKKLKIKKAGISIALVDEKTIKQLNRCYRGKDKVTDVLSFSNKKSQKFIFPLIDDYLGEIIICYPQAQKQAKEFNQSIKKELTILLTHGLFHLLGYSHSEMKKLFFTD